MVHFDDLGIERGAKELSRPGRKKIESVHALAVVRSKHDREPLSGALETCARRSIEARGPDDHRDSLTRAHREQPLGGRSDTEIDDDVGRREELLDIAGNPYTAGLAPISPLSVRSIAATSRASGSEPSTEAMLWPIRPAAPCIATLIIVDPGSGHRR